MNKILSYFKELNVNIINLESLLAILIAICFISIIFIFVTYGPGVIKKLNSYENKVNNMLSPLFESSIFKVIIFIGAILLVIVGIPELYKDIYKKWNSIHYFKTSVGKSGVISYDVVGAITIEDFKRYEKALDIIDSYGVEELIKNGKTMLLYKGTSVLIIDKKYKLRKVRVKDGPDDYQIGEAYWIPYSFIKTIDR
ncbi:MAG: hypothetical protein JW871_07405 [Endomicrobiales bacterium]|nr:hypothetical protein [Endomicrobiales bacterium]